MSIGRRYVDSRRNHLFIILREGCQKRTRAVDNLGEMTWGVRRDMQHDEDRRRKVLRKLSNDTLQNIQSPGRSPKHYDACCFHRRLKTGSCWNESAGSPVRFRGRIHSFFLLINSPAVRMRKIAEGFLSAAPTTWRLPNVLCFAFRGFRETPIASEGRVQAESCRKDSTTLQR